jgi:hypothetical protein
MIVVHGIIAWLDAYGIVSVTFAPCSSTGVISFLSVCELAGH